MMRKVLSLSILVAVFIGMGLSLGWTTLAFAQEEVPLKDTSCIGCHEDQYWLYDSGKWYCLGETKVRCTECHRGHTDTVIKESAHEGMIANPLVNDAAVCQNCHPDDYRTKVQTFASIAGVSSTPVPYATCTPPALVAQTDDGASGTRFLRVLPAGPWQAVGAALLGTMVLVVFLFGCRCWKIDQHYKLRGQERG